MGIRIVRRVKRWPPALAGLWLAWLVFVIGAVVLATTSGALFYAGVGLLWVGAILATRQALRLRAAVRKNRRSRDQ